MYLMYILLVNLSCEQRSKAYRHVERDSVNNQYSSSTENMYTVYIIREMLLGDCAVHVLPLTVNY